MIRSGYCASALTVFGVCAALAQTVPAPTPTPAKSQAEMATHDEPALFKARVNLVMVPVVVRDRQGKAVGTLKQDDFQLFDKGKPQYIARFSMERAAGRLYKAGGAAPSPALTSQPVRSRRWTCRTASSPTCSTTCT
jgi:hypothetical protein